MKGQAANTNYTLLPVSLAFRKYSRTVSLSMLVVTGNLMYHFHPLPHNNLKQQSKNHNNLPTVNTMFSLIQKIPIISNRHPILFNADKEKNVYQMNSQ